MRNLSNCEREAWKKFRLQRDSNPWPLRYRCSALPTELWSHNCWEQVNFSGSIMPLRVIQHYSDWVCTAVMSEWRHERSSRLIRNLSNCERDCTGIAEVTGSNPAEAWIFFRLLFRNCSTCIMGKSSMVYNLDWNKLKGHFLFEYWSGQNTPHVCPCDCSQQTELRQRNTPHLL